MYPYTRRIMPRYALYLRNLFSHSIFGNPMFVQDPYFRRDLSAAKFTSNTHEIMPHDALSFRKIFIPVSAKDATGRRRLIGSSKLQIIFHKRATEYRSLLRKMTYREKGSYESSPPCTPLTPTRSRNSDFSVSRSTNFKSKCWFDVNLFRGISDLQVGGFQGCSVFVGICHIFNIFLSLGRALSAAEFIYIYI